MHRGWAQVGAGASQQVADPYANEPARHPALVVRTQKPFNAETPGPLLAGAPLTPVDLFYVRNHLPVPHVDAATHTVRAPLPPAERALPRLPRAPRAALGAGRPPCASATERRPRCLGRGAAGRPESSRSLPAECSVCRTAACLLPRGCCKPAASLMLAPCSTSGQRLRTAGSRGEPQGRRCASRARAYARSSCRSRTCRRASRSTPSPQRCSARATAATTSTPSSPSRAWSGAWVRRAAILTLRP